LARQGSDVRHSGRTARFILIAILSLLVPAAMHAQGSAVPIPSGMLHSAQEALGRGDTKSALEILRRLRADFPASPEAVDALALSVQAAIGSGDLYKARYFHQTLAASNPSSRQAIFSGLLLAGYFYAHRDWPLALSYYAAAAQDFRDGASGNRRQLDLTLLRAAELTLYHGAGSAAARVFFQKVRPSSIAAADAVLYRQLRVRLLWSHLPAETLGLADSNISSLRIDDDDLWVGTWNGGVSRYSVSSGSSDPFPLPAFTRSLEVADRRVWVGTSDGLSWYGKVTGRWGSEKDFAAPDARNVQVVRQTVAGLFAGTLGDGLFRLGDTGWTEVSDGSLPGRFVISLAEDIPRHTLLIGTMNIGLVILDLTTGSMSTLDELVPGFTSSNITTLLRASDGTIWIGTYGDGLWAWDPDGKAVRHFSQATGELANDWILSSCEGARALYFGSFGGGVSVLGRNGAAWRRFGIADGLASLDVAAIAWRAPFVFFGTLGAGVSQYDEEADGTLP
jgi:hypothetical protein